MTPIKDIVSPERSNHTIFMEKAKVHKIFHCKRIELTVKLESGGIQWNSELVSWPNTGRIKL